MGVGINGETVNRGSGKNMFVAFFAPFPFFPDSSPEQPLIDSFSDKFPNAETSLSHSSLRFIAFHKS